jgi:DNA-binding protein
MVAAKGQIKNYLGYAFRILNKTDHRKLTIRATGNAIVKALILIELVKRKVGEIYNYDLHQQNKIYSMEIVSLEESKVPGMGQIESKRRVTAMDTILSKDPLD